jgi:hypothetical protein
VQQFTLQRMDNRILEHDPEKHAPGARPEIMLNQKDGAGA